MQVYKRTEQGYQELSQRRLRLSARTRTLLLLLESDDLKQLSQDALAKIAHPENFKILLDLNLISATQPLDNSIKSVETRPASSAYPHSKLDQQTISLDHVIHQDKITIQKPKSISDLDQDIQSPLMYIETETQPIAQIENLELEPHMLDLLEIKTLMQNTLKQYCGLMAKNLIVMIEKTNSISEIRQHQSKWLTSLFETRISRQQLNELLKTINQSMDKIEFNS